MKMIIFVGSSGNKDQDSEAVNLWQKASALKCMDSPKHEMAQESCE